MANPMLTDFLEHISKGLRCQTLTTCSRWSEYRRIMGAPFPGPYSFKHHPWCREITDSTASYNTAMKAAQMGVTEIAINRALYTIDILKRDVLYVLPTLANAGDFSKARFGPALTNSPYLASVFTDTNTVGLKQAGGVNLYIRGSRGNQNLKSIPVSTLILDEMDEMDQEQIWLALARLSGQVIKNVWSISTPTVPKHGIHKMYVQGTQEHFHFKCPRCGKLTELIWPDCVEIIGEFAGDPRCRESYIKCKECQGRLEQQEKVEFLKDAIWVPTAPQNDGDHRSFYVNQLYSSTVTAAELVQLYLQSFGDEGATTKFHNERLGVPYLGEGAQVTDEILEQCGRGHTKNDKRPPRGGERLITMGVDQGKLNHIVIMEWVMSEMGRDINVAAAGKLLWEGILLGDEFTRLDYLMREWQVIHCVIDAQPETNEARRFARRFPGYVSLCMYRKGQVGREISQSEEELDAPVVTVDRTNWIDAAMSRFHNQRIILPRDVSHAYKEHIKNLVRTYKADEFGNLRAVYENSGDDHFAHAQTYAEIALPLAASHVTNKSIGAFL
jgi:hypothetical protein